MDTPFGSWGAQTFIAYVEQVLVPELESGTVVVLGNLATHKNAAAAKASPHIFRQAQDLIAQFVATLLVLRGAGEN
jgi:hypothetical protein